MTARWYFDFVSPFAYLQLPKLREWRCSRQIEPVPVVLGALLAHHGTLGPAEIPGRREFTYRFVQWQAERDGIALRFPPAHPFNSLAALRLCLAAGNSWDAVELIFDRVWRDGNACTDAGHLAPLGKALGISDVAAAIATAEVKSALRRNSDAAIAAGVFGVPTLQTGSELFWGNDASPMVDQWLADPDRFAGREYRRVAALPIGVTRRPS